MGTACGQGYLVHVSALQAKEAIDIGKKAYLHPVGLPASEGFEQHASQVAGMLEGFGYSRVTDADQADVIVLLGYGVSDAQIAYRVREADVQESLAPETSVVAGFGESLGSASVMMQSAERRPTMEAYPLHEHWLYLAAYPSEAVKARRVNPDAALEQLWELRVTNRREAPELAEVFPAMLAVARGYIGRNTQGTERVLVQEVAPSEAQVASR